VSPSRNEHTIAASCELQGRGYWSGQDVHLVIHPAKRGTGVQLVRSDLPGLPQCQATVDHRQDASLRTNLACGDAEFQMIEHLMAALFALEIDNCIVEIDSQELPGLDGSSLAYVQELRRSGLIVQACPRQRLVIRDRLRVGSDQAWIEAAPSHHGESYFEYQLSFDNETPIARQTACVELAPDRFIREVAPARTFVTSAQADQIRASGLAQHVTNQDLVVIGDDGPIDNSWRFHNECARHKTLDLIGDLALAGVELVGRFTSFRGGHSLNGQLAKALASLAGQQSAETRIQRPPANQLRRPA
jgi:UDP-3-O-[3-hydroxymyristoyl] N-acetylglucosamine deacetylase